jgi:glycosyltransferase involved in cell wall biosynthesis
LSAVDISVVIPVYNRQSCAERAVRSVLNQQLEGMEVIIVDDCSRPAFTVPTELARSFVHLLRHEANMGPARARTSGVAASRGNWIAFLDSDDYWLDNTLAPRFEVANRHFATTHDVMVAHAAGFALQRNRRLEVRIPRASADLGDFVSSSWLASGSTALVRREAFEVVGPFDPALRRLEDFDWFLRFALLGGRVEVWRHVAALIEKRNTYSVAEVKDAISRLRAGSASNHYQLPPELGVRLDAYLDLECAALAAVEHRYLAMIAWLGRSFWRLPRGHLHLNKFWEHRPSAARSLSLATEDWALGARRDGFDFPEIAGRPSEKLTD